MSGHGMISANFTHKLIMRIEEGRLSCEKAEGYLAKFCVCGVFNTRRAIRVLNGIREGN